ncbi:MAG: PaaI family thioesterase [Kofleriaceae bacterium]
MPRMTIPQIEALIDHHHADWRSYWEIKELGENDITVRMVFRQELLRAGGTVSGPGMMALADTAAYFLVLAHVGPVDAATSSLDIHFLTRPQPVDVTATASLLRLGSRLVVTTVDLRAATDLVARATVTYAVRS